MSYCAHAGQGDNMPCPELAFLALTMQDEARASAGACCGRASRHSACARWHRAHIVSAAFGRSRQTQPASWGELKTHRPQANQHIPNLQHIERVVNSTRHQPSHCTLHTVLLPPAASHHTQGNTNQPVQGHDKYFSLRFELFFKEPLQSLLLPHERLLLPLPTQLLRSHKSGVLH